MDRRLLLVSNELPTGFDLRSFMGKNLNFLLVPYAIVNSKERRGVVEAWGKASEGKDYKVASIEDSSSPKSAIEDLDPTRDLIYTFGGNTFLLLNKLLNLDLVEPLGGKLMQGVPYIGFSSGAGIACPTIQSTNDDPIVWTPTYNSLNAIPFQIKPHYLDASPSTEDVSSRESDEKRVMEYHDKGLPNSSPVVGLREGSVLKLEKGRLGLIGEKGARLFRKGKDPLEFKNGDSLDFLLENS